MKDDRLVVMNGKPYECVDYGFEKNEKSNYFSLIFTKSSDMFSCICGTIKSEILTRGSEL